MGIVMVVVMVLMMGGIMGGTMGDKMSGGHGKQQDHKQSEIKKPNRVRQTARKQWMIRKR